MKHAIYGIVRAQDNNDTSYISAAYSTANMVLVVVCGHTLQCMFEEHAKDNNLNQCMRFPTMWQFDMCRLGRASAASF